jgi:hypothetical protein
VHAGREVLMEVDDISLPIAGDALMILGQQLKPRQIHLLNIVIMILITKYIICY